MKLTYLGTAAAEGMPAVWCNCAVCKQAKEAGGKNIRTRSQILIDTAMLLDFPMDTYMHMLTHKLDLSAIDTVLITHAHMDHCYPQEFVLHGEPFAHGMTTPTVTVYGNQTVARAFIQATAPEMRAEIAPSVPFRVLHPFDRVTTASGYTVTALPARHTVGEECLVYVVEKGGKSVFLCNDTRTLSDETYDRMAQMGLRLDLISFDCTYGHARGHEGGRHMGSLDAMDEREKMAARGLTHADTKYVLTHFSHNSRATYDQMAETEKGNGFLVAYDGLTVEV